MRSPCVLLLRYQSKCMAQANIYKYIITQASDIGEQISNREWILLLYQFQSLMLDQLVAHRIHNTVRSMLGQSHRMYCQFYSSHDRQPQQMCYQYK